MIDLIPIGTVNRPANENNAAKPSGNVQETTRTKALSDQEAPAGIERRRPGNRRRGEGDRRRLQKGVRTSQTDRRRLQDRRAASRTEPEKTSSRKSSMRKGRLIDERV